MQKNRHRMDIATLESGKTAWWQPCVLS